MQLTLMHSLYGFAPPNRLGAIRQQVAQHATNPAILPLKCRRAAKADIMMAPQAGLNCLNYIIVDMVKKCTLKRFHLPEDEREKHTCYWALRLVCLIENLPQ